MDSVVSLQTVVLKLGGVSVFCQIWVFQVTLGKGRRKKLSLVSKANHVLIHVFGFTIILQVLYPNIKIQLSSVLLTQL